MTVEDKLTMVTDEKGLQKPLLNLDAIAKSMECKLEQESPAVADKPARRLKSGSRATQGHRK